LTNSKLNMLCLLIPQYRRYPSNQIKNRAIMNQSRTSINQKCNQNKREKNWHSFFHRIHSLFAQLPRRPINYTLSCTTTRPHMWDVRNWKITIARNQLADNRLQMLHWLTTRRRGWCLKSEEQQESHHKTEQTHGFRQSEPKNGIREELLLQWGITGVTDDQATKHCSNTGPWTSNTNGGSTSTDEFGGWIDITLNRRCLEHTKAQLAKWQRDRLDLLAGCNWRLGLSTTLL